jgi:hypothetical protein
MTANQGLIFARRVGPQLVLGCLVAVFILTGWIGLDFGYHWDEQFALEEVSRPLENGVFLPRSYNYPAMVFDIGSVALSPKTIPFLIQTAKEARPFYSQPYQELVPKTRVAPLVEFAKSKQFLLRLRGLFLVITSLTGIWVFIAVRACKRSGWEAAFAAGIILTSWEIAYHARWVAPDGIQMQFASLWLMFFALALHSAVRPLLWLRLSAVAAGFACGTKYQGGILLLPIVIYATTIAYRSLPSRPLRAAASELAYNVGIFTACFLISTPGMLLEPLIFVQSLRAISHQYVTEHIGFTVDAVGQHGYLLLTYLIGVLTSHWPVAAVALSAAACLGVVKTWNEHRLRAMLFMCAPVAYLLFMICYRVMIVRNYLVLTPFIALFAARGVFYLWESSGVNAWIRRVIVTACVAILVGNAMFLYVAAQTVRPHPPQFGQDIVAYLKEHAGEKFLLSPRTAQAVAMGKEAVSNTTSDPNLAQRYMSFTDEASPGQYSCNRPGQYQRVSGPLEVNFDYYASWQGAARVIDVSILRAREMQLLPKR